MVIFKAYARNASNIDFTIEADRLPLFGRTDGGYYTAQYGQTPPGPEYVWQVYNSCVCLNGTTDNVSFYGGFILIFDQPTDVDFYIGGSKYATYTYDVLENGVYGRRPMGNTRQFVMATVDGVPYLSDENNGNSREFIVETALIPYTSSFADYKAAVTTLVPPTYQWSSVPAISGKNGILSLAQVDTTLIGDGDTTQTSHSDTGLTLPNSAKLINYLQNLEDGVETTVLYCGDNYLTLQRSTTQGAGLTITGILRLRMANGALYYQRQITGYYSATGELMNEYLGFYIDETNQVARLGSVIVDYHDNYDPPYLYQWNDYHDVVLSDMMWIYEWLQGSVVEPDDDPYDAGSTDNGGEDGMITPQDSLPSNSLPSVDGMATGMFTVWLPSDTDMVHISNFLWSNNVIDNILKYFNSVNECVLGLYILPYVPTSGTSSKKFKIGNLTDDDYSNVTYLTNRYRTIDMGSFELSAIWDSYLDFAPYTKLEIFLPYCGIHNLDVDELMCPAQKSGILSEKTGSTVSCEYRIDLLTGGVVVYLKVNNEVRYQFSGKMGCNLPVTGNNYNIMVQTMIQGISGLASTIANHAISAPYAQNPVAPSPTPLLAGATKKDIADYNKAQAKYDRQMESRASQLGSSAGVATGAAVSGVVQSMKPDIIRCGNISGDLSMMGYDRPYLIKTRPNKPKLEGQKEFTGLPSYKKDTVGNFEGYTEFIKVHITDVSCTGQEQEAIEKMLLSGVIIESGTATPDVTPVLSGNLVIVLMKMKSEVNVIGKTWSDELKIEGKLIYDNSVTSPVILINGDCTGYNYAYVPFFNRFYYIQDYIVTRDNMQELHMSVDPLQSFKSDIENCVGIVSRSQNQPNYYINDGVFYTEQRTVVTYHCFKKDGEIVKFNTQQLYLITAGG